jgi:predicted Zn-dependent peptidase
MVPDTDQLASSPDLPSSWRGPFDFVLENGLRVLFAQREKSPIVEVRFVMDSGFATDPDGRSGLAALAMAMFSEGLIRVDDAQVGFALEPLGAVLHGQLMPDAAVIGMSALNANLGEALSIYVNALTQYEFKIEDLELLQANYLARIADEHLNPFELALRVLPPMVYGRGHIYARPFTGSGIERDVAAITPDDLRSYYAIHLMPQCSTLVVAGSCDTANLRAQLEETFKGWRPVPGAALSTPAAETAANAPSVMIVNRPDASQAVLAAGLRTLARNSGHAEALTVADTILSGIFTSRLNLSLRERKGWTYGVRSLLLDARLQGLWLVRTAVRTDCAAQAMAEIAGEIENLAGRRPSRPDEFSRAVDYLVARIPASYETCAQMADALGHVVIYRLPIGYAQNLASCLRRLRPDDVTETCRQILAAGGLRWLIVGEAAELVNQLRNAGFGNIVVVESNSAGVP